MTTPATLPAFYRVDYSEAEMCLALTLITNARGMLAALDSGERQRIHDLMLTTSTASVEVVRNLEVAQGPGSTWALVTRMARMIGKDWPEVTPPPIKRVGPLNADHMELLLLGTLLNAGAAVYTAEPDERSTVEFQQTCRAASLQNRDAFLAFRDTHGDLGLQRLIDRIHHLIAATR